LLGTFARRRGKLPRNRRVVYPRRVAHTPPREPGGRRQGSAGAGMGSGAGRATEIRRSAGRLVPRGWGGGRAVARRGGRAQGVFRPTVAGCRGRGIGRSDRGRRVPSLRRSCVGAGVPSIL